jgi:hypothetical protein
MKKLFIGIALWLGIVSAAHLTLNVNWGVLINNQLPEAKRKLNVAYIPVT